MFLSFLIACKIKISFFTVQVIHSFITDQSLLNTVVQMKKEKLEKIPHYLLELHGHLS